jgi:hypothetical protein
VTLSRAGFTAVVSAVLAIALIAWPAVASARFTSSSAAALRVSTDTLAPPTNVSVKCLGSSQRVTISWAATTDTYATGYVVYSSYGGSEASQSVSGGATTSVTPFTAVRGGTVITIVSTYRNWTSARSAGVTAPYNCR